MFHLSAGNLLHKFGIIGNGETHSPPRVKLLEKGLSIWTGAIFDILDVFLSLPEGERLAQNVKTRIIDMECSQRVYFSQLTVTEVRFVDATLQ